MSHHLTNLNEDLDTLLIHAYLLAGRVAAHNNRINTNGPNPIYETNSSMMSSDLESTSFFDSEDESSRLEKFVFAIHIFIQLIFSFYLFTNTSSLKMHLLWLFSSYISWMSREILMVVEKHCYCSQVL